jgi:arsenite methyltransferase
VLVAPQGPLARGTKKKIRYPRKAQASKGELINMTEVVPTIQNLDVETLRQAIQEEYQLVAREPGRGFHFHTGRPLARILGYQEEWLEGVPETSIESFAGTGNPFSLGELTPGQRVLDLGSGAGIDSLIAARMVGSTGQVVGVDMTEAMVEKARRAAREAAVSNVDFRVGYLEDLPVADGWADVVISNGVFNLVPGKAAALSEMYRALKPGGRLQLADILVEVPVPEAAKGVIDLWTG